MSSSVRRKLFFGDYLLLVLGSVCFLLAGSIHQRFVKPVPDLTKQDTALNINKDLLIFLSAGNKRMLTDLLWVQTLIEGDIDHYAGKDLNSWMYLRFNTISALDPYFYQNYLWGGQYLSIIKDDLAGAVDLMETGLRYFPDDYRLNYNLGFSYYYELGDYQKGIRYMEKIEHHPKAPVYIPSLIMKMKVEVSFDYDTVLSLIFDLMTSSKDEALRKKLTKDFHALKAERDLKCLNSGQKACEPKDAYGKPYVKRSGKFHSVTPFVPYRLKKKGDYSRAKPVTTIEE